MSSNREISNTEIMGFVNNDVDALPIGDKAKTIERLERAERIWKAISERAISLFDNHDDVDCDTDALYSVITDT